MDPNWQISLVRTIVVPAVVGIFVQWICFLGSDPPALLRVALTALFAMAWYVAARLAQFANPQLGFLLIISARPRYDGEDELAPSIRRTAVPLAVATVLGCLFTALMTGSSAALCLVAAAVVYYGTLRWVEEHSAPNSTVHGVAGWLLGARAVPYY